MPQENGPLSLCRECGQYYQSAATSCPHCGCEARSPAQMQVPPGPPMQVMYGPPPFHVQPAYGPPPYLRPRRVAFFFALLVVILLGLGALLWHWLK